MRTQSNLDALVDELTRNCGDFYEACRTCLLSPSFVRKWMKEDEDVKQIIDSACEVGALQLDSAAIKRAVNGVDEDVFYQGEVVGQVKKYSDSLLALLLKKRRREVYGDEPSQTNVNVNLQQAIQVMPRAKTYEEWIQFTQQAKALPQGGEVIDITPVVLPAPTDDPAMADIL